MATSKDSVLLVKAFVYGVLSVCTFGVVPSYLSTSEQECVQPEHCKRRLTGGLGLFADFCNISAEVVNAVRSIAPSHKV